MIKLTHRLALFGGLNNPTPRDYGFNTMQAAFDPFSPGNTDAVCEWVSGTESDMDVLLAFTPQMSNVIFLGASLSEEWYHTYRNGFIDIKERLGDRVVGCRWNHEYRASCFSPSKEWEDWMRKKNLALWTYVCLYQKSKWFKLLEDTKQTIHPVAFLEQSTGSDWDRPSNADFRTTFRLWCQFQCERQAVVINRLEAIAAEFDLPMFLYPGGRSGLSPRLLPELEYSLDQTKIGPGVILEAGGWHDRPTAWIDEVAHSIRHPFIWTNQIGQNVIGADPLREFGDRLNSRNAVGAAPQGIGFWCNWTADFVRQTPLCQEYLNRLREVLTR